VTPATILTRSAGRVEPGCIHEDPEMYPEFLPAGAPTSFACTAPATVYLYRPAAPGEPDYYAGIGAFCDAHAGLEAPMESVAIADLPLVCSGCSAPVWLAHADEHVLGRCDFCQVTSGADHASCSCPLEAEMLAAMGGAS
jgi:hypothetical protein